MCGIAGILDSNIVEKEKVISDMVSALTHRGPDDNGYFVDSNVALGMRRLSIIDLSTGKQPITSTDEKNLIFFNGEIYNYKELREELLIKGFVFKTHTDTEVILNMFLAHGEQMLNRLRGMFAFCIYNTETKKVFIARDFFGIKPLYYLVDKLVKDGPSQSHQVVAFSSEIKSFLSFPGFKREVNNNAIYNYLSFQYNPLEETFFKNVYKLPPGHYMHLDLKSGKFEIEKYWSFEFKQGQNLDEKAMSKTVFDTVKNSVKHHMIADVPVGAFLSGGIDSSIITTLMQQICGEKRVKTFTVGFEGLTEGEESKETASYLETDHTEIKITANEYFNALSKIVYHFDEPVADPSAVGLYFVARETAKHVKVVLSGEGADELFGGYNIYLAPFASHRFKWLPKIVLKFFLNLPFEFFGKNYLRRVDTKVEDWYIGNASVFKKEEIKELWKGDNISRTVLDIKSLYQKVSNLSDSTKMQYIDINTWLVGDILAKADKMTMAHSLELRVPFLDIEVAKLASTLPDKFKWRGEDTKYLLREAFKKVIPETTRKRKKLGFPTPIRDWFTKDKSDLYNKILKNEYIECHMNIPYIRNLIEEHITNKADNSRKIYSLLMLALWYDTYSS